MNLLYVTFGKKQSIHTQAAFSIYSFLANCNKLSTINIVTDNADNYTHFGKTVNLISVTDKDLIDWQGDVQFFWRIKIKALEMLCNLYPNEPIVYVDTDTYLFKNDTFFNSTLTTNIAIMHENEGIMANEKSGFKKKMWNQIKNKTFGDLKMKGTHSMWNAGVVATPNTKNAAECSLALAICDDMCKQGITRRLIEQYALSLSLQHIYGIEEAKSNVLHYWSAKDVWDVTISNFFNEAYCKNWTYDTIIEKVKTFDYNALPIYKRVRNTNLRLKKVVDNLFPTKDYFLNK